MRTNFILPTAGIAGGVRVVCEYANRLSERGHEVTILYPTIPSKMDHGLISPWARITQIAAAFYRFITNTNVNWFLDVYPKNT